MEISTFLNSLSDSFSAFTWVFDLFSPALTALFIFAGGLSVVLAIKRFLF